MRNLEFLSLRFVLHATTKSFIITICFRSLLLLHCRNYQLLNRNTRNHLAWTWHESNGIHFLCHYSSKHFQFGRSIFRQWTGWMAKEVVPWCFWSWRRRKSTLHNIPLHLDTIFVLWTFMNSQNSCLAFTVIAKHTRTSLRSFLPVRW